MPRHCCACFFRCLMGLNVDNGVSQLVRWNKNAVFKLNDRVWEEVKQKRLSGLDRFPDILYCLGVSALFAKLILTRRSGRIGP